MSGKNPFKVIEEQNVNRYQDIGPNKPVFLDTNLSSSIQSNRPSSGSPDFPSFS